MLAKPVILRAADKIFSTSKAPLLWKEQPWHLQNTLKYIMYSIYQKVVMELGRFREGGSGEEGTDPPVQPTPTLETITVLEGLHKTAKKAYICNLKICASGQPRLGRAFCINYITM